MSTNLSKSAAGVRMLGEEEFRRQNVATETSALGARMAAEAGAQWVPPVETERAAPPSPHVPLPENIRMVHRWLGTDYSISQLQQAVVAMPRMAPALFEAEMSRDAGPRPRALKILERSLADSQIADLVLQAVRDVLATIAPPAPPMTTSPPSDTVVSAP